MRVSDTCLVHRGNVNDRRTVSLYDVAGDVNESALFTSRDPWN